MRAWHEIEADLRRETPGRSVRTPDDFWSDFRAHASLRVQERAAPAPARFLAPRWAVAAAALAVVAALLTALPLHRALPAGNRILALNISAAHQGVIIMNDRAGGTILWIDCDEPARPGGVL
jgi:hypothetical protein